MSSRYGGIEDSEKAHFLRAKIPTITRPSRDSELPTGDPIVLTARGERLNVQT
jgi:hypothetical protein